MEEFRGISTTFISDVTQGLNNMDSKIRGLTKEYKLVGTALTVQLIAGDNLAVLKAIQQAKPGDVLVIDAKGETYRAVLGDIYAAIAKNAGIEGIVIDGVIRDIEDTLKVDLPIFCLGSTMASPPKNGGGLIGSVISCGGVSVKPGDIIVGDINGVTVIPNEKASEIYQLAKEKQENDALIVERISKGEKESRDYLSQLIGQFESGT